MITLLTLLAVLVIVVVNIIVMLGKYCSIPTFIVFLILKLCGAVAWSWLIICIPLFVFVGAIIMGIIVERIDVNFKF